MNYASELIQQAQVFTSNINGSCRSNVILIPLLSLDIWIQEKFKENNNKAPEKSIVIDRAIELGFTYINYRFAKYETRYFILPGSVSDFPSGKIQSFDYFIRKFKEEEEFRTYARPINLKLLENRTLDNIDVTTKLTFDFIQRTIDSGRTAKNTGLEIMMSENESESSENMNHTQFEDANETLNEEINRSFNGNIDEEKEETKFAKTRPRNTTTKNPFVNQHSVKDDEDSKTAWKSHKIPRLKESGLGVKDWADKCVFLVEFGREKKLTDKEKCQLILQNIPFASFGPIMDDFQQEDEKTFKNLKDIIEDQIQLDEMEAGVTLQNTKFDENRDKDMRRFYERIKKLIRIKYPSLKTEGLNTTSMEHFERLMPSYIRNSESWGLDTYDASDPAKRILLANRIFLMQKDRRHINALTDRKNNSKNKTFNTNDKKCNNCGRQGHIRPECRLLPQCYNCGKRGHKSNECRSKMQNGQTNQKKGNFSQPGRQNNYPQQNNQFQNKRHGNSNSGGRGNKQGGHNNQKGGCFICGSPHHWKRECTHKQVNTFGNNGRYNQYDDEAPIIRMRHSNE